MKPKQYRILGIILFVSAFAGGMIATRLFDAAPAKAQEYVSLAAKAYQVVDNNGNVKMLLTTKDETNQPTVIMYDDKGEDRAIFSVSDNGEPQFSFWDKNGKLRFAAAVPVSGATGMDMLDKNEKPIWSRP